MIKSLIKKIVPASGFRMMHKIGLYKHYKPFPGNVSMGDFKRLTPFSNDFGYDRGGPVDRYYIENFLSQEAPYIKGRVLEIGDNEYTLRYGKNNVQQSDILHVDATNPKATFVGDLSDAPQLPDNAFDAIVLTQTLHLIYDYKAALATCHRVLKPGGVLLLTVPGITPIDHGEWNKTWYWAFTDKGMKALMNEMFPDGNIVVDHFGNVMAATSFLYGMGLPEVDKKMLDHKDPFYQVIVTVRAQKKA